MRFLVATLMGRKAVVVYEVGVKLTQNDLLTYF